MIEYLNYCNVVKWMKAMVNKRLKFNIIYIYYIHNCHPRDIYLTNDYALAIT